MIDIIVEIFNHIVEHKITSKYTVNIQQSFVPTRRSKTSIEGASIYTKINYASK